MPHDKVSDIDDISMSGEPLPDRRSRRSAPGVGCDHGGA
ncbi:hypothetical protein GLA29479_2444 [Lysobacter antibioticus]|uniref:Uncharacterized protein n=1 Tax=Lysobacter antibioticus TaxID=84531 RepID=A0A0S2FDD2_LYSAN|nr:hypothetical protein GLA29479_2444 [Lysobacter antibioticus]ALN81536.1 hypothetical protein LA76x_3410 [Lysobacter antibioticus]